MVRRGKMILQKNLQNFITHSGIDPDLTSVGLDLEVGHIVIDIGHIHLHSSVSTTITWVLNNIMDREEWWNIDYVILNLCLPTWIII